MSKNTNLVAKLKVAQGRSSCLVRSGPVLMQDPIETSSKHLEMLLQGLGCMVMQVYPSILV